MAREFPRDTPELPTPILPSAREQQEDQEDGDLNQDKIDPAIAVKALLSANWEEDGKPMPVNAEEFKADPCPGGVRAQLTLRFPNGQSHSLAKKGEKFPGCKQARRTLYRRALRLWNPALPPALPTPGPSNTLVLPNDSPVATSALTQPVLIPQPSTSVSAVPETRSRVPRTRSGLALAQRAKEYLERERAAVLLARAQMETAAPPAVPEGSSGDNTVPDKQSVQVQTETVAPPVAPEWSSEGNTVLGKRSTRSEDEEGSESVADAQPREMHGTSYCAILAAYCYESGYAQAKVTFQLHVGDAGVSGRPLYHVSMSVGKEYFSLQRSYDSIAIATERLSEQALNSFGIRPKRI